MHSWIQQRLYRLHCPFPTLIDGNMGYAEWIEGEFGPLKTGYYRHGWGKTQLNVIDPAYDLAETILSFALSPKEEDRLDQSIHRVLRRRRGRRAPLPQQTARWPLDHGVCSGTSLRRDADRSAAAGILSPFPRRLGLPHDTDRAVLRGALPSVPAGGLAFPLVMLDVDGVLDRRVFGYPTTSAAGMEALSLLASRGCSIALNTARSAAEVRDYCQSYGLAGGVAEPGAYLWDAVAQSGQPLIDRKTMAQLDELRKHLRQIPGVFLDDRHQSRFGHSCSRSSRAVCFCGC